MNIITASPLINSTLARYRNASTPERFLPDLLDALATDAPLLPLDDCDSILDALADDPAFPEVIDTLRDNTDYTLF